MSDAERWPIDFDAVRKGDSIPVERLEAILGVSRFVRAGGSSVENAEYQKLLKDFQGKVKHELRDRGIAMTVVCDHGQLVFLTDEDAAQYNPRLFRSGERRMRMALRQAMGCDAGRMTDETREQHHRNLIVMGAKVAALKSPYPKVTPIVHERKTPGLPLPESQ